MKKEEIKQLVENQRTWFYSGTSLNVEYRIQALQKLKTAIEQNKSAIAEALKQDLGKSDLESYMCEIGLALSELNYMLRHIRSLAKPKRVRTPITQFPARSYRKPSPYGVTLIMSPWNYPFLLTLDPLIDALAAGNASIVKPSAYSAHTSAVIKSLLEECFPPEYVAVVTGGREENTCLLEEHFDYIFFTGSQYVGKEVMQQASVHLTPVTLELGGKSPCIIEKSADLKLAARRIVFGKFLNCGQTCVAPDYIYCDPLIKESLVREIKLEITRQFGSAPLQNADYGKIINEKHFHRLLGLIDKQKVVCGGDFSENELRIAPTVLDGVTFEDAVMQEEIFGPILPIVTYHTLDQAIRTINALPHPLALYLFTTDKSIMRSVTSHCGFGGGCINDVVVHLSTSELPFGGFGESGMGSYHGKEGFYTFSHRKSILDKKNWLDLPMRYQPYTKWKEKLVHLFLK